MSVSREVSPKRTPRLGRLTPHLTGKFRIFVDTYKESAVPVKQQRSEKVERHYRNLRMRRMNGKWAFSTGWFES